WSRIFRDLDWCGARAGSAIAGTRRRSAAARGDGGNLCVPGDVRDRAPAARERNRVPLLDPVWSDARPRTVAARGLLNRRDRAGRSSDACARITGVPGRPPSLVERGSHTTTVGRDGVRGVFRCGSGNCERCGGTGAATGVTGDRWLLSLGDGRGRAEGSLDRPVWKPVRPGGNRPSVYSGPRAGRSACDRADA